MATLRVAEEVHPKEASQPSNSQRQGGEPTERINGDGIYNIRSRFEGVSQDRSDEDPDLRREGDYKTTQVGISCEH